MSSDSEISGCESIADWIETTVIARNSHVSCGQLDSIVREELRVSQANIALARAIMARRSILLGTAYPFDISSLAIVPRRQAVESSYAALLMLSPDSPPRRLAYRTPTDEMVVFFEKLVAAAMCRLLGAKSSALRFGWPSDEGRPKEFDLAISWLCGKMGIDVGRSFRPPRRKDGGVDVVAWRPFCDGKSGFPVFLVQCTLQRDIEPKSSDIDVRNWAGWLTLDSDPTTVLAIPGTIGSHQTWRDIAIRTLILDRIRLVELLGTGFDRPLPGVTEFTRSLIESVAGQLKGAEL